jgi:hypothetical protein
MRSTPVLFCALCACAIDNTLHAGKEQERGRDTSGETGVPVDTDFSDICEGLSGSPHAVSLNDECEQDLQTGSFTPVVEYSYGSDPFCGPPAVGQIVDTNGSGGIDDEDMPAILIYQGGTNGTSNGAVQAVAGDNSSVYWTSKAGLGQDGGFSIGDLDGDGWPEVVAASTTKVTALDGQTGTVLWTSASLGAHVDSLGYNYPSIADMDGDGNPEVTIGNVVLNGQDGSTRGLGSLGIGAAPYGGTSTGGSYGALSVPYDLDGDGELELVTGNAAYTVDGDVLWRNTGLDGIVAIADFDGDGEGEIVKTSGIYVTGMETDGTEVWGPVKYTGNLGAPAIDDLDDDGVPDIVFAAQNALVAMDWGGTEKWEATISDSSGAAGPVLFDFELDGYPEVLYADEKKVRFFSGLDGSIKFVAGDHASYTILETPVVADVDNDGQVEIVLGHCGSGLSTPSAFSVYGDADESWPAGRKIWNQHAYTITNVGDRGDVPSGGAGNNFADYNSFRSGDVGQPPGEYYDLQAEVFDVCEKECDEGTVWVGAWILNAGNLEAPAGIAVSILAGGDGEVLDTQYTTAAIPSGESGEALIFGLDADALGEKKPVAAADMDLDGVGTLYECNEENNQGGWDEATCTE